MIRCQGAAIGDWGHANADPGVDDRLCSACRAEWQRLETEVTSRWELFAMREDDRLHSFYPSRLALSLCGDGPIVRVALELDENGPYWGWRYSFHPYNGGRRGLVAHVYGNVLGVEICFPYGTAPEIRRGHGRIVRLKAIELEEKTP